MKYKVLLGLLVLIMVVGLLFGACSEPKETTTPTPTPTPTSEPTEKAPIHIKVGFLGGESGPWGAIGVSYRQGAQLAADHINQDGWFVIDGQKYIFDFQSYDTRGDAKTSVAMANKLVQDGVKIIVAVPIESYKDDQTITEAAKVITVAPGLPGYQTPGVKYTFNDSFHEWMGYMYRMICAPTGQENKYTVFKNVNSLAILVPQETALQNMINGFREEGEILGNNIPVVFDETVPLDETDFSSVLNRLKSKDPDLTFCLLGSTAPQLVVFPQMRDQGFTGNVLNMDDICNRDAQARILATDAANGVVESAWYLPHTEIPPDWVEELLGYDPDIRDRYVHDVMDKFGATAENAGAAHAYDMMYGMLKTAWLSGDPLNPDAIVAQAEKEVHIKGACTDIWWWKEDHMYPLPVVMIQLKDINNTTGDYSFDYLASGKSLSYWADVDFSKAEFEFNIMKQVDCSKPRVSP